MSEWIDVSLALRTGMAHWPGDVPVQIRLTSDMKRGDGANVRTMVMSAHTGTHIDAPLHFVPDGGAIDVMPPDATIGPARLIEIEDEQVICRGELEKHTPQRGERLLFKTRNSQNGWCRCRYFLKNFVHINPDAARYLVECGVRTVGVDYLSVGAYKGDGAETHRILLQAGIWAIEGLDFSKVAAGSYELICLPLKIEDGDGAPARAVLRKL